MKTLHPGDVLSVSSASAVDLSEIDAYLQEASEQPSIMLRNKVACFGGRLALDLESDSTCMAFQSEALGFRNVTGLVSGELTTAINYPTFGLSGPISARIDQKSSVLVVPTSYNLIQATMDELDGIQHPNGIMKTYNMADPCRKRTRIEEFALSAFENNGYETTIGYRPDADREQGAITVVHPRSRTVMNLGPLQ